MQHLKGLVDDIRAVLRDHLNVIVGLPDEDLLETGLVDSIGLVELILHLEDRFGVSLPMDALEIDDFRSINTIADLITGRFRGRLTQRVEEVTLASERNDNTLKAFTEVS